jgi:hypothetical protein
MTLIQGNDFTSQSPIIQNIFIYLGLLNRREKKLAKGKTKFSP